VIWFFAPASLVAVAYFLPGLSLRSKSLLKPFVVALVWMVAVSLVPYEVARGNEIPDFATYNWIKYRGSDVFFFIASLCILFDLRDMESDRAAGVKTVAVQYGVNASKIFAIATLAVSAFMHFYFNFSPSNWMMLVFFAVAAVILFTNRSRGELYYLFLVDGMILLRALMYWFLS
jgi:4-hydroxybenzoate polyprenyltransferase